MGLSTYTCSRISSAYDGIFLNRTKNLRIIRSSELIAERPEKVEV